MKCFRIVLSLFFICVNYIVSAQVSQGGSPMVVEILKSNSIPVVRMPEVNNSSLLKKSIRRYNNSEVLKPFKFAETFDVNLNTENSGRWINDGNGYRVWQVRVSSKGAFSLNFIFEPFKLPPNARLYIYNKNKTHVLGALTEYNNKSFNSLAVSPVSGDDVIIQYEEPINPRFKGQLEITKVNHDFAGILADENGRRPLGVSGDCNIDINCDIASDWNMIKNSVCRVIVKGTEVCTGALINNTSEDKTPYVITANHCFENYSNGEQNTVYLFNYESPYCGAFDGDISNSVSGSLPIASSDSLDFSLVELTVLPPPEYRPYYVGWNRTGNVPDSVASIHHPIGDIKKIALDYDNPIISSFGTHEEYVENAFWKTLRWDQGTTEAGSSGGPYFNQSHQLIGTLTGGAASCGNSVNDYFERFDLSWNHFPDSVNQLKCWLDPGETGALVSKGITGFDGELFCNAFTHLNGTDTLKLKSIDVSNGAGIGFWGGTNSSGITEYVEKFSIKGNEVLQGISLGVGLKTGTITADDQITIKVYNGHNVPDELIYSKNVSINSFVRNAMNYIEFDEVVEPVDTFFIGFDLVNLSDKVLFSVLTTMRKNKDNSLYYKQNGDWTDFNSEMDTLSAALAFELVACNVESITSDTPVVNNGVDIQLYPNPVSAVLNLKINSKISEDDISVFNLLGMEVPLKIKTIGEQHFQINLSGNTSGIYFVRVKNFEFSVSEKFYFTQ